MKKAVKDDKVLQEIMKDQEKGKMSDILRNSEYRKVFWELTSWEGLILKGVQLVIPPIMREVFELAHETHGFGTSFDKLKPVLKETWVRHGVPRKVTHNWVLQITHVWEKYASETNYKVDKGTPEHP